MTGIKKLMLLNCGVGETLESPFNCEEIQPVHSKGDQSWVFFGRTDAKAETKSWLIGKDSDAGRDWGQEEKWMTEDEMAGWYHRLDGCEFEWTLGVGDGQGGLPGVLQCMGWQRVGHDWATERLNWSLFIGLKSHDFIWKFRGKLKPWYIMWYIYIYKYVYIPKLGHKDTVFKIELKEKGNHERYG